MLIYTVIFLIWRRLFSSIFFSIETKLDKPYSTILGTCNPVAFLLTSTRKAVMYCSRPDLIILLIWFLLSVLIASFGVRLIRKNKNRDANYLISFAASSALLSDYPYLFLSIWQEGREYLLLLKKILLVHY